MGDKTTYNKKNKEKLINRAKKYYENKNKTNYKKKK